jgi:integrase
MFPKTPSAWFSKWLKRVGLPPITFHQLRHSHATILIANGIDIDSLSRRLGHAKISTTMNRYIHAINSRDAIAVETLNKAIPIPERVKNDL